MRSIFIFLIFIISCANTENVQDTYFGESDFSEIIWKSGYMNLNNDLSEIDSIEFRLWMGYGGFIVGHQSMFLFKKINDEWICYHYKLLSAKKTRTIEGNTEQDLIDLENGKENGLDSLLITRVGGPKSGWNNLFNELEKNNLFGIKNQVELEEYQNNRLRNNPDSCDLSGGISFTFELLSENDHKFIRYHCPKFYSECLESESNRKIYQILMYLRKEFDEIEEAFTFLGIDLMC